MMQPLSTSFPIIERKLVTNYDMPYKEGKIVIIEGPQRCGKTLAMAILALDEFIATRQRIITNLAYEDPLTGLNRIPYKPLNFFELTMDKIGVYRNCAITIDELNFYLDSRGSMTKINRRFCQWLLQSKKMGITTYGTTHGLGYLDLRFRENFDYLINPTTLYENKLNSLTGIIEKKPAILILKWFNGPNQKYFKKTITIDLRTKPHLLGLYNTRHTFNPFAEMEEQMELEKMQKKKRKNQGSRLNNIVPNYLMQADDESVGESLW